jgi:hypothetical protein
MRPITTDVVPIAGARSARPAGAGRLLAPDGSTAFEGSRSSWFLAQVGAQRWRLCRPDRLYRPVCLPPRRAHHDRPAAPSQPCSLRRRTGWRPDSGRVRGQRQLPRFTRAVARGAAANAGDPVSDPGNCHACSGPSLSGQLRRVGRLISGSGSRLRCRRQRSSGRSPFQG